MASTDDNTDSSSPAHSSQHNEMRIRSATRAISVEDRCVVTQLRISSQVPTPGSGCDEPRPARHATTRPTGMPTATTTRTTTAARNRSHEPAARAGAESRWVAMGYWPSSVIPTRIRARPVSLIVRAATSGNAGSTRRVTVTMTSSPRDGDVADGGVGAGEQRAGGIERSRGGRGPGRVGGSVTNGADLHGVGAGTGRLVGS